MSEFQVTVDYSRVVKGIDASAAKITITLGGELFSSVALSETVEFYETLQSGAVGALSTLDADEKLMLINSASAIIGDDVSISDIAAAEENGGVGGITLLVVGGNPNRHCVVCATEGTYADDVVLCAKCKSTGQAAAYCDQHKQAHAKRLGHGVVLNAPKAAVERCHHCGNVAQAACITCSGKGAACLVCDSCTGNHGGHKLLRSDAFDGLLNERAVPRSECQLRTATPAELRTALVNYLTGVVSKATEKYTTVVETVAPDVQMRSPAVNAICAAASEYPLTSLLALNAQPPPAPVPPTVKIAVLDGTFPVRVAGVAHVAVPKGCYLTYRVGDDAFKPKVAGDSFVFVDKDGLSRPLPADDCSRIDVKISARAVKNTPEELRLCIEALRQTFALTVGDVLPLVISSVETIDNDNNGSFSVYFVVTFRANMLHAYAGRSMPMTVIALGYQLFSSRVAIAPFASDASSSSSTSSTSSSLAARPAAAPATATPSKAKTPPKKTGEKRPRVSTKPAASTSVSAPTSVPPPPPSLSDIRSLEELLYAPTDEEEERADEDDDAPRRKARKTNATAVASAASEQESSTPEKKSGKPEYTKEIVNRSATLINNRFARIVRADGRLVLRLSPTSTETQGEAKDYPLPTDAGQVAPTAEPVSLISCRVENGYDVTVTFNDEETPTNSCVVMFLLDGATNQLVWRHTITNSDVKRQLGDDDDVFRPLSVSYVPLGYKIGTTSARAKKSDDDCAFYLVSVGMTSRLILAYNKNGKFIRAVGGQGGRSPSRPAVVFATPRPSLVNDKKGEPRMCIVSINTHNTASFFGISGQTVPSERATILKRNTNKEKKDREVPSCDLPHHPIVAFANHESRNLFAIMYRYPKNKLVTYVYRIVKPSFDTVSHAGTSTVGKALMLEVVEKFELMPDPQHCTNGGFGGSVFMVFAPGVDAILLYAGFSLEGGKLNIKKRPVDVTLDDEEEEDGECMDDDESTDGSDDGSDDDSDDEDD